MYSEIDKRLSHLGLSEPERDAIDLLILKGDIQPGNFSHFPDDRLVRVLRTAIASHSASAFAAGRKYCTMRRFYCW